MVGDCEMAFLGLHNFVATKVEVFNENNQEYEIIDLVNDEEISKSSHTLK